MCDTRVCIAPMTEQMRGAENLAHWQKVCIVERWLIGWACMLTLSALQVGSRSPNPSDPDLGFVDMKINATFLQSSPLLQAGNPGPYHCDLHADQDPSDLPLVNDARRPQVTAAAAVREHLEFQVLMSSLSLS